MIGADVVANAILARGITRVFLFPGGTIAPVLDSLDKRGVELFTARHEQGAGYAALAVARLTRKPQVVLCTSGPGVTNMTTVVADAYFDSVPLIVICGQVSVSDTRRVGMRQLGFQEVDTAALMAPISKGVLRARDVSCLNAMLWRAFAWATEGRPGPIIIDLPMNVQREEVTDCEPVTWVPHERSFVFDDTVQKVANLINDAEKPVIIAGQGVLLANAHENLRELANKAMIPVSMSMLGLGAYPTNERFSLGYHGHTGNQAAGMAIYNSDLLLVLGSRLDVRQTGTLPREFAPDAKVIRVDIDDTELDNSRVPVDVSVKADVGAFLEKLLPLVGERKARDAWLNRVEYWIGQYTLDVPVGHNQRYIITLLDELTRGRNVVVVTGVGQHQQWAARHFTYDYPNRVLVTSGGHGAMGFDLPAAVGAQLARPDALVLCIVGDGSIQMNMQELGTIRDYKLPIKIVVLDNHRLGMVSQFMENVWGHDATCGNKGTVPFMDIAGAYGFNVSFADVDIVGDLQKMLNCDGPALIHCFTDPREDISPMLLGGQRIDQMWTDEGSPS